MEERKKTWPRTPTARVGAQSNNCIRLPHRYLPWQKSAWQAAGRQAGRPGLESKQALAFFLEKCMAGNTHCNGM